jgi:hypothetical protein
MTTLEELDAKKASLDIPGILRERDKPIRVTLDIEFARWRDLWFFQLCEYGRDVKLPAILGQVLGQYIDEHEKLEALKRKLS